MSVYQISANLVGSGALNLRLSLRMLPSGIGAVLKAQGAQPGYLVRIDKAGGPLYRCSLDVDYAWNGSTWISADIDVSGMEWSASGTREATLTLGDAEQEFWAYAAQGAFRDAAVSVWQIYGGVLNAVVPLWLGRMGRIVKDQMKLTCTVVKDSSLKSSPRRRVQMLVPSKYLLPPGKIMWAGGQWTLERQ